MAKKSRNKKTYKRMVPKMIKFENERIKQMLGMIPTPEDTRFSFRKYFQERDTKPDVEMTELSGICNIRSGADVQKDIKKKKTPRFETPSAIESKDIKPEINKKYNLGKNEFPVWMSTRKQKKIVKKNRKIKKIKLNNKKQILKNKREVMKLKKHAKHAKK